jgi:poly-gamma-glutamate capsule biosynthesis protein CapA/YwtB (metallophosphatase superfamily)
MRAQRGRAARCVAVSRGLALIVTLAAAVWSDRTRAAPSAAPADPAPGRKSAFDPRRPPERELEIGVADGFTLAAVGDCIISRPHAPMLARDSAFAAVVKILRDADAAFGNFEDTAIDLRGFKGSPHSWLGDWTLIAPPEVPADLKTLGIDLLSRANNHTFDWGSEGMMETDRRLDEAGLVHAGTGVDRGAARAAQYFETGRGRVGLVSMASTFPEFAEALPPRGGAPGRPGLNALKVRRVTIVPAGTMRDLVRIAGLLGTGKDCPAPDAVPSETPDPRAASVPPDRAPAEIDLFGEHFRLGDRAAYHYEIDPIDLRENLQSVRLGKQHSDLMLVTIHAHEEALGCGLPGDFLRDLAHAAIDAGAGVFLGHGIHHLGPIEIYKGRPIFYGLGNFFWGDIQQPLPANLFEQYRDLLSGALDDPERATDADLTALLNARDFQQDRVFQTIVAVTRYTGGRASEIRLYPVDLGYGMRLTRSGVPRLASASTSRAILEGLQRLSQPYGTTIRIEDNVGVIRPG